jgi:hypothetical protein
MTTDISLDNAGANSKMFTEDEVKAMMEKTVKDRLAREAENTRLQKEENERLKKQLEELHRKADKGTATTDELAQIQTANYTAANAQAQGIPFEQARQMVKQEMQMEEFHSKLEEARDKDPEFAKLLKDGNKLYSEEVDELAYLPNAASVIKHLLKDKKSFELLRTATRNYQRDGGIGFKMVANNLSDKLADTQEKPMPSQFKPAEQLSDASDEDQNFDEKNYISSKY